MPTDMLTAAEMIAVRQVVNTGNQYLHLSDQGAATGGGFHVSYYAANGINNLVIPEGVRASQNAALLQSLNLTGNLTNNGTFNVFSSDAAVTSATVSAVNICNNANAVISSTLANLTLSAVNNIVNSGTITSTGSVAMTAGNSISNNGVVQALQTLGVQANTVNNQALMAATTFNLVTANLVSAGILQSLAGQLNISSPNSSSIMLNNISTVLTGLNLSSIGGTITLSTTSLTPSANLTVTSGNIATGNSVSFSTNSNAGGLVVVTGNPGTFSTSGNGAGTVFASGNPGPFNSVFDATTISGNITVNGSGSALLIPNGTPTTLVTVTAGGNVFLSGNGATTTSDNQPAASQAPTTDTSVVVPLALTFSTGSTAASTANDARTVSSPVISTDINAVTPLAIFAQIPTSTMSAPVASTIMHTISGLNQLNMIPSTAQAITPFTLSPTAPPSATPSAPGVQSPYQKIAYTTGAPDFTSIEKTTKELSEVQFDTCLVRHSGNSDISYRDGQLNLNSGEILVHSPQRTYVASGEYLIAVDPGTVALITRENKVLKIRALYEPRPNMITVKAGETFIKVSVGQEVLLAPQSVHLQAANKKDNLGRRHVVEANLPNGHAMSRSEFSHVGLIEEADVLTKLFQSQAPHDRQLSGKLLKMAACLMTVTGGHGAYSDK